MVSRAREYFMDEDDESSGNAGKADWMYDARGKRAYAKDNKKDNIIKQTRVSKKKPKSLITPASVMLAIIIGLLAVIITVVLTSDNHYSVNLLSNSASHTYKVDNPPTKSETPDTTVSSVESSSDAKSVEDTTNKEPITHESSKTEDQATKQSTDTSQNAPADADGHYQATIDTKDGPVTKVFKTNAEAIQWCVDKINAGGASNYRVIYK